MFCGAPQRVGLLLRRAERGRGPKRKKSGRALFATFALEMETRRRIGDVTSAVSVFSGLEGGADWMVISEKVHSAVVGCEDDDEAGLAGAAEGYSDDDNGNDDEDGPAGTSLGEGVALKRNSGSSLLDVAYGEACALAPEYVVLASSEILFHFEGHTDAVTDLQPQEFVGFRSPGE